VIGGGSYVFGGALIKAYDALADKPYLAPVMLVIIGGAVWLYLSSATKRK
jgi:hypothetical protein